MEEAPNKLAEAFRLFLQGLGYVPNLRPSKSIEMNVMGGGRYIAGAHGDAAGAAAAPAAAAAAPATIKV